MMEENKTEVKSVQPKDLNEALDIIFINYMNSVDWIIQLMETAEAPYRINDRFWYADQLLSGFKQKIDAIRSSLAKKKQEEKDAKILAETNNVVEGTSIQTS